jgi:hypothetical protein
MGRAPASYPVSSRFFYIVEQEVYVYKEEGSSYRSSCPPAKYRDNPFK